MANKDTTITQELLHQLFDYCDGCLYWKQNRGRARKGALAGYKHSSGYILIETLGKLHKAHRLIWIMHNNVAPEFLDHINGIRHDNRIENLRIATKQQNNCNMKAPSTNKSGAKNVHWHKDSNRWRVQIKNKGQSIHIGYFDNFELARFVASEARLKYHAEFARNF